MEGKYKESMWGIKKKYLNEGEMETNNKGRTQEGNEKGMMEEQRMKGWKNT